MQQTRYMTLVDRPYGYWTLDEDEMKRFKYWMTYNPIHTPEPLTPFSGWYYAACPVHHGYLGSAEKASHPATKGATCRINLDGYAAMSEAITVTPEEAQERGPLFGQFMAPFIESFDELWGDFRHKGKAGSYLREMQENYARLGAFDLETWSCDPEKFFNKLKGLPNVDLHDLFRETINVVYRHWEIHFEILYTTFTMYMIFEGLTMELFGFSDTDPRFQRMIQGFDNHIYEFDRELWRLIHLAADLNLADTFKEVPEGELISKLGETDSGRKWLEELPQFLALWGIRSPNPFEMYKVTWFENPTVILALIRDYLTRGLIDYDAERRKIADEREKTVAELLEKVPPGRQEEFKGLLKAAQTAYCWNEDHGYWIEQMGYSTLRYVMLEMGKRLHKAGAIAVPDDIFFLNVDEIDATFLLAVLGTHDFREFVDRRKAAWKAGFAPEKVPPKVTGEWVREETRDPVYVKIFGLGPMAVPAEKVDVFGYPGSPGVAEGIAQVITAVDELYRVEAGSILVTGATGPAWSPIFGKLKAVVTDHGGALTHAAIVGREYGIPAVVGTSDATIKIKDGQRIRVDGNRGLVYILG